MSSFSYLSAKEKMLSKIKELLGLSNKDTFIGLISEDGIARIKMGENASLGFSFCAYAKNGSEVLNEGIYVKKDIPHIDVEVPGLEAMAIVEIKGEEILFHSQKRILLDSIISTTVSHPNLEVIREERQQAVIYESETFGPCKLDRKYKWFRCEYTWMETVINLYFNTDQLEEMEELEKTALSLFNKEEDWDQRIKQKITEELLSIKNENWLEENENPLTPEEFQDKIRVEAINIHPESDFQFWYDDGDTFWGHSISIDGKLDGTLEEVGIHG